MYIFIAFWNVILQLQLISCDVLEKRPAVPTLDFADFTLAPPNGTSLQSVLPVSSALYVSNSLINVISTVPGTITMPPTAISTCQPRVYTTNTPVHTTRIHQLICDSDET